MPLQVKAQDCGCKGARFCQVCLASERVKSLKFVDTNISDDQKLEQFEQFLYCSHCQSAYPVHFSTLSDSDAIFVAADVIHEQHLTENSQGLQLDSPLLVKEFVSEAEEKSLVNKMDMVQWVLSQSGRRKQDYGPKVNFKKKKVNAASFYGMPDYSDVLLDKMTQVSREKLGSYVPLELCNLEYEPSRGSCIDFHMDDTWIWGPRLISLNLLSGTVMILLHEESKRAVLIPMPRRSLLCMDGSIRYQWKHGILASHIKERRIALTMREPSEHFMPGGDLFEKFGKELLQASSQRIPTE